MISFSSKLIFAAFLLNLIFLILLFIIADLNWITSLNGLLSFASLFLFPYFSIYEFKLGSFSLIDWICIDYFLSATYGLLFAPQNKNSFFFKIDKLLRFINFEIVPFELYSEPHLENICSYDIEPNASSSYLNLTQKINAFTIDGKRSSFENFRSIHLHALVYSFTNYANHIYFRNFDQLKSMKPGRYSWQSQLKPIFKYISPFHLSLYQYVWDKKKLEYKKNYLFTIKIASGENFDNHIKKKVNFENPLEPRVYCEKWQK